MRALRRRLGCSGPGRATILATLRSHLPERSSPRTSVALTLVDDLHDLVAPVDFDALAQTVPWRGDGSRLLEIASWGAVIAGLTTPVCPNHRAQVAREAALFNVGVAVFDSAVEEMPALRAGLARALDPRRLRARLADPDGMATQLTGRSPQEFDLVRLFDVVLCNAGRRWAGDRTQLGYLADLLERMFLSEMGISRDFLAAKRLPVVFIGALGHPISDHRAASFYDALGRFVMPR